AIILFPILVGLILWNSLPEILTTHWGIDGHADGWSSKAFAVFVPPFLILVTHWICVLVTTADPKNKNQNKKAIGLVFWICPIISLFANGIVYGTALGIEFSMELLISALFGVMFIVLGNYLPKFKQNYTLGIKVPWTLANEENWNKTHRFSGKLWVIGGLILMTSIFFPEEIMVMILVVVIAVLAIVPIVYSYCLYKKQMKNGEYIARNQPMTKYQSTLTKVSLVIVAIILIAVIALLFTGNIEVKYGENSFTLEATYWHDLEIDYAAIDSIEYREQCDAGSRTNGFGSLRLLMGTFKNDEFGSYTRYSYTNCDACIVLQVKDKTLVISGTDEENTKAIYNELVTKTAK
ncbi:MAG: SdpI family protein, partial [Lysinibacillus sp.]